MRHRSLPRTLLSLLAAAALVAAATVVPAPTAAAGPAPAAEAAVSNLAPTPPMGWNSWNTFACDINEQLIRDTADAMVASGMRDAGYEYVNIDDCWMARTRDAQGRLQADPVRFPSGIAALADYVHARGMKLGIYSSAGTLTCAGYPASLGHEVVDAQTWASWGVDYLKYDNCNNQGVPALERYRAMGDALAATGRDIVYSLCEWGSNDPWLWGRDVGGHLWRTTGDITDSWTSVMSLLDQQVGLEPYSGPNGWNDPDMLEVGNPGLSVAESRAHMSLWALLNAPLIAGNDVRDMQPWVVDQLTDPEVLAVDQDWGGVQGHKVRDDGAAEVWAKPMSDGGVAVVLLNRGDSAATITTTATELGLAQSRAYALRDLWADTTRSTRGPVRATVPAHDVAMLVVTPTAPGTDLPPAVSLGTGSARYVEAGQPATVTTALHNDGLTAVEGGTMTLTAPAGWTVTGDGAVGDVPPGRSVERTWTLTPPAGAAPGRVELTATATWVWRDTNRFDARTPTAFHVVQRLPSGTHQLSDVDWVDGQNGWGPVERDLSNGERDAGDGRPLTIGGTAFAKGLGVHAPSALTFFAGGGCTQVTATVGVDDEVGDRGSVVFEVWADDRKVAATGVVRGTDAAVPLAADVTGAQVVELRVTDGGDDMNYDHADWADARISCG